MTLSIFPGGKKEDDAACPRCGGNHFLIACPEVSSICFDFDDYGRWVTVEFFDCREDASQSSAEAGTGEKPA